MLPELFARFELIIYIFAAFFIVSIYWTIRTIKLNQLIKQKRLTNVKLFRFGAETSIAVSEEGLIGAVNFRLNTLTVDINEIKEFEILLGRYSIENAKASKNNGLLFSGIDNRLRPILAEERLKEVNFIIAMKNKKVFGINLHKSTRLKFLTEAKQNNIVQLFTTLQAVEKRLKDNTKSLLYEKE